MRDEDRPSVLAHQRFAAHRGALIDLDMAARFARIHDMNLWGAETSRSGLGSEHSAVAAWASKLPPLLRELGVITLLDAPCGDAAWISAIDLGVEYIGVDIVPALIEGLQARASAKPMRRYLLADITQDPLPRADAILCRDCLVHLSFSNIARVTENFRRSGAVWLIATTFPELQRNKDCEDGDWRALNMERAPFSWPAPNRLLNEACEEAGGGYRDKSLGVWRLAAVSGA